MQELEWVRGLLQHSLIKLTFRVTHSDQDFVFGLPQVIYGDPASASSLCCAEVLVKEPNSGKTCVFSLPRYSSSSVFVQLG